MNSTNNTSRLRTIPLHEGSEVSNSVYKIRLTPASQRQTPAFKSRESLFFTNNSNVSKSTSSSICHICKQNQGVVQHYCHCQNILYHDRCLQDKVRLRAREIHEGAFICNQGCHEQFRINSFKVKDITMKGKILLVFLLSLTIIQFIILLLLILYWNDVNQILIIFVMLFLVLLALGVSRNGMIYYYKMNWTIKPIHETHFKVSSFHRILPFIVNNRDVLYYNNYDIDSLIQK